MTDTNPFALTNIKLINFKNYEQETAVFDAKLNCFVGLNGMGKTNLLDAIYYLCVGRSFFSLNDRMVVRKVEKTDFFRLEGLFSKGPKEEALVIKVMPGKQKAIEHNRVSYSKLSEHLGKFPVVISAPFDVALVMDGSEERRRFMDQTFSQCDSQYLSNLMLYNKILSQRNAALKKFAEFQTFDPTLIAIYNRQLIPLGQAIYTKRKKLLEKLEPIFKKLYQQIADSDSESVQIYYQSSLDKTSFEALLNATLEKDRILQRTTKGIHKDDLVTEINDLPLKRFASQGQLKSFILALKLAQYQLLQQEKVIPPILLLDDLFDRLDNQRVKHLLSILLQPDYGQIFITDTTPKRIYQLARTLGVNCTEFLIEHGRIVSKIITHSQNNPS